MFNGKKNAYSFIQVFSCSCLFKIVTLNSALLQLKLNYIEYFVFSLTEASSANSAFLFRLDNIIPQTARSVKKILNSKCCFHVICLSTPPHEQGSLGVKAII